MQETKLTLHTERERRSSPEALNDQLSFIAKRALAGNRGRGWDFEVGSINIQESTNSHCSWIISSSIRFYRKIDVSLDRLERQTSDILEWASAAGHNARFGKRPWIADGPKQQSKPVVEELLSEDETSSFDSDEAYIPLHEAGTIKPSAFYNHLYGLDSQIAILLSALQAASDSNMVNRFHTLLFGSPGCGKTEILQSTAKLLKKLGVNYLILDATSTTEAGMRKNLLDEDKQPPEVLLIEEIEKVPEASLRWLLGIMDVRGTISQANYRKTASRKVPAIVLATANDIEQLKRMMYGALHSRFQHEVYCPRPNREVLSKILKREVLKVSGDDRWIEAALTFCYDENKTTDPRKIIPVCLCGKEELLTGIYQDHLRKTMKPNA